MFKKMIAMFIVCAMLVPLSPAVAADEPTSQPTIEEILNAYHAKAFEAQAAEENGGAATYSRRSSTQTLEQETVAELTAAGYEAYNVTGENYETLEETLNTDFAEMGLNPDSSYVVVISGEDPAAQSNANARAIDPPTADNLDGDISSGTSFLYHSDGSTDYLMRRITITAANDSGYLFSDEHDLINDSSSIEFIERILNHIISTYLDDKSGCSLGTILGLLGVDFVDIAPSQYCTIKLYVGANRSRTYTQVFHYDASKESGGTWVSHYSVEHARVATHVHGQYYDSAIDGFVSYTSPDAIKHFYSENYYNHTAQNEFAAAYAYDNSMVDELIGDIYVHLTDAQGNILGNGPIFVFREYVGTKP